MLFLCLPAVQTVKTATGRVVCDCCGVNVPIDLYATHFLGTLYKLTELRNSEGNITQSSSVLKKHDFLVRRTVCRVQSE